ncbi:Transcriptional regulator, partial [Dysosmobacter welbionis]
PRWTCPGRRGIWPRPGCDTGAGFPTDSCSPAPRPGRSGPRFSAGRRWRTGCPAPPGPRPGGYASTGRSAPSSAGSCGAWPPGPQNRRRTAASSGASARSPAPGPWPASPGSVFPEPDGDR